MNGILPMCCHWLRDTIFFLMGAWCSSAVSGVVLCRKGGGRETKTKMENSNPDNLHILLF